MNLEHDIRPDFVKLASDKYQRIWKQLSDRDKSILESQATLRVLDTSEKCDRFFESRDLRKLVIPAAKQKISYNNHSSLNESYDPVTSAMKRLMK